MARCTGWDFRPRRGEDLFDEVAVRCDFLCRFDRSKCRGVHVGEESLLEDGHGFDRLMPLGGVVVMGVRREMGMSSRAKDPRDAVKGDALAGVSATGGQAD
jgi:hypothetical protein